MLSLEVLTNFSAQIICLYSEILLTAPICYGVHETGMATTTGTLILQIRGSIQKIFLAKRSSHLLKHKQYRDTVKTHTAYSK